MTTKTNTARKSTAKVAKTAKKVAKAKTKTTFLGYDIPDTAKIKVVGENPRRKGSSVFKQYEKMRGGRTVAAYLKSGGRRRWLPGAVRRKFIAIAR